MLQTCSYLKTIKKKGSNNLLLITNHKMRSLNLINTKNYNRMSIKLNKNWFIFSFSIVLFSLISISLAQAGCVVIKVQYQDGCPRSGATVDKIDPPPTLPLGISNENGYVEKCDALGPGTYLLQATYGGFQFGPNTGLNVNEYGDGITTIQKNSNYPSESCGNSGCSGRTYCDSGVVKCDASCVEDVSTCLDLGACQCRVAGTPCLYPDCCTSSKSKCCLLGSAKTNECNSNSDCYSGWCCIKGWQSNCCMPPGYCGCGVTTTTTKTSTTTSTSTTTITTTSTTTSTTTTTTRTTTTSTTTTTISGCSGSVSLTLSPNPVYAEKTVNATASGLTGCDGKKTYISYGAYKIWRCQCTVTSSGCSCTFAASSPYTSGTNYIHYARIDKNGDGDYNDTGEEASKNLTILCQPINQSCSSTQSCCIGYTCLDGICQRPTGGCPVLKVWDGNEYKDVVKLNIHSERGKDTTTSIGFTMKPKDGKYYIKLSEIWYALLEGSHIDSVKLVDGNEKECKLVSAIHDKKGDVLSIIANSDDIRIETKPGEEITLTFDECKGEDFVFSIEGYNPFFYLQKMSLGSKNLTLLFTSVFISLAVVVVIFAVFRATIRSKST
jgi:hypothetical protein